MEKSKNKDKDSEKSQDGATAKAGGKSSIQDKLRNVRRKLTFSSNDDKVC